MEKSATALVIAGHSALKTRVNALTTRQSIVFAKRFAKKEWTTRNRVYPISGTLSAQVGQTRLAWSSPRVTDGESMLALFTIWPTSGAIPVGGKVARFAAV